MTNAQITITRVLVPDPDADTSYLTQKGFEERYEAWEQGEFDFVGVVARATIRLPYGKDWIETTLDSPGLWSIESDSGEAYLNEVYAEETTTLIEMLDSLKTAVVIEQPARVSDELSA